MQRIVNLLVEKNGEVLLLKKPRRGWYVAPGGKMDPGESILETAVREFKEETGAEALAPQLKGVFTMVIQNGEEVVDEWMLHTFAAHDFTGTPMKHTVEGDLEWHPIEALNTLPMAEGDRTNLLYAVSQKGIQYGTFTYTEDFKLLDQKIQQPMEGD